VTPGLGNRCSIRLSYGDALMRSSLETWRTSDCGRRRDCRRAMLGDPSISSILRLAAAAYNRSRNRVELGGDILLRGRHAIGPGDRCSRLEAPLPGLAPAGAADIHGLHRRPREQTYLGCR
jgi:hypothetical protein